MARGWESKAVADQIEEGKSAREALSRKAELTPDQKAREEKLASLLLSKSRLLEQLERAKVPAHRNVLLSGLNAIEDEIEGLKSSSDT